MSFRDRMHPQRSRMEEDVRIDLQNMGYNIMTDQTYLLQLPQFNVYYPDRKEIPTTPDLTYKDYNAEVYLDGKKVHEKRKEKDVFLRKLLELQYDKRVKGITYKGNSKRERRRIVAEIKAFLEAQ